MGMGTRVWVLVVACLCAGQARVGRAEDACAAFKWDVHHERTLFAGQPTSLTAGHDPPSALQLASDTLYELALQTQADVTFSAPPGKRPRDEHSFAGLARLRVSAPGAYRVSLSQPGWIDIVSGHGALASSDFAGAASCDAPHKIVQFELPAGDLVLQLSSISDARIRLTLTRVP